MLSPQLLTILRIYWRLAKPAHWLFPGRDAGRPVSTATLQAACRVAVRAAGRRSRSPSTPCATASPPICSRRAPTSASSRSCSATAGWRPPRSTPASPRASSPARPARSTVCPGSRWCRRPERPHAQRPRGGGGVPPPRRRLPADPCRPSEPGANAASWRRSRPAARRRWAVMSSSAPTVAGPHRLQLLPQSALPEAPGLARAKWLADRQAELLPVPYFHRHLHRAAPIAEIAFQNKTVVYGILFQAAAETLRLIAADPGHLGAAIGLVAVLHTWGQNLQQHPHLHCVVPGGGPSADGTRWIGCRPGFFLPVKVLSSPVSPALPHRPASGVRPRAAAVPCHPGGLGGA